MSDAILRTVFLASLLWSAVVGVAAMVFAIIDGGIPESDATGWTLVCAGPLIAVIVGFVVGTVALVLGQAINDLRREIEARRLEREA